MLVGLLLFFPLLGAILNGFILPRTQKSLSHAVGVCGVAASFLCSIPLFLSLFGEGAQGSLYYAYSWIEAGSLDLGFELVIDRLSGLMLLIVTGIGTLIHVYAGGYMHEEKQTYRFFAYLNLFVFMMLLLVLGNNFLVMFVGWEGVGLCSYLLIGYWYEKKENSIAGMKAFVVNRIGDFAFLIGIFLCYKNFQTLSFSDLNSILLGYESVPEDLLHVIALITLCLFVGACGKSAQIPLYVWLPDAMAGPTPVSALIHAATMVTAGIYMMTRLHVLFYLAPSTMLFIAFIGAFTAIFAASIAVVQNDIKKVLAYSTVSQLGFMVLACGVGAFDVGVFHLLTHACFKALLFLGAGSVIVAMHHKQDIREMGGLSKMLPMTYKVFLVGVLAIIGFPGFSGFFSKDEILWKAFNFPEWGWLLWTLAMLAAMMTAFYMVRLLCLTFYGKNRSDKHTRHHIHETPPIMWAPLVVLAFLSAFIGFIGVPDFIASHFGFHNIFAQYLSNDIYVPREGFWSFLHEPHSHALEWGLMLTASALSMGSAATAFVLYRRGPQPVHEQMRNTFAKPYDLLLNKYGVDELYFRFVVNPLKDLADFLWRIVDLKVINGFINVLGHVLMFFSSVTSLQNSGSLQRYAAVFMLGLIAFVFYVIR